MILALLNNCVRLNSDEDNFEENEVAKGNLLFISIRCAATAVEPHSAQVKIALSQDRWRGSVGAPIVVFCRNYLTQMSYVLTRVER